MNNGGNDEILYKYSIIRETVSAVEVGKMLGLDINGKGRCRCPFHNGADRNMMVYPGNRGFYCFVCHESGDCIALAKKLLGDDCRYHEAARWIDDTFRLNLFENRQHTVKERARKLQHRRTG